MIGSYAAAHLLLGPPLRRRDAGIRDLAVFGTVFYFLFHHKVDQRAVPDVYLDELFTQESPNGDYLRVTMGENMPLLWGDIRRQLERKGFEVPTINPTI